MSFLKRDMADLRVSVIHGLLLKIPYIQKRKKSVGNSKQNFENIQKKLRTIPFYNDYNGKLYKLFWGQTIKNNAFNYSSLFHIKRKDAQQFWDEALPEYKWLYYEAVLISLNDLDVLRSFQMELQNAYAFFIKKNEFKLLHQFWGKKYSNHPEFKQLVAELEESKKKLYQIWNPVSCKFHDQRTPEQIREAKKKTLLHESSKTLKAQSEGLRQLYEILGDRHLSQETREEVLETIELIEKQEEKNQEKEKFEHSETNARVIIDASKAYYHLS